MMMRGTLAMLPALLGIVLGAGIGNYTHHSVGFGVISEQATGCAGKPNSPKTCGKRSRGNPLRLSSQ